MDLEKEGRDFVIGTLVGTPRQDVFVPWQRLTALTGVEKVVQMAAPAAGADGDTGSRCDHDEQAGRPV